MISRLQQAITVLLVLCAASWFALWWRQGHEAIAVAGALAFFTGHAAVIGLEFLLLRRLSAGDPTPPATDAQLIRAWISEALQAPVVFCWRQPFRSRRYPDNLPSGGQGRRGVLLVHGFVCNRGLWNPWMPRLRARGVPFLAVNLDPVFGDIDDYTGPLQRAMQRLREATGQPPLIVAHSMGGLAVRAWWRAQGDHVEAPYHVVTIGTPHQGTWLGRFGSTTNTRQMCQGGKWIRQLERDEPPSRYRHFTCFYSHCDNVVFPPVVGTLPGADNRHLPGWSHVHLAYHPEVFNEVLLRLGEQAV